MIFDAAEMLYRTSLLDWPGLAPGLFLFKALNSPPK